MAASGLRNQLICSICLNIYTDPVTLRCGHNFCQGCIDQVLDTQEGSGVYVCPDCREEHQVRPALYRNLTLRNIADQYLSALPEQEKTYNIRSDGKSSVMCEDSLCCCNALKALVQSEEHTLSDPTTFLGNRNCSIHNKLLQYYCKDDDALICIACCLTGHHSGHQVVEINEAYEMKKKKLENLLESLTLERMKTIQRVQSLQERMEELLEKAAGQRERAIALFSKIRRQLEELEEKVLSEIHRRENHVFLSVSDLIQHLERKKDELSKKMSHIEDLCTMCDPATVLQDPETGDLPDFGHENRERDVNENLYDVSDLTEVYISEIIHTGLHNIMSFVRGVSDNQEALGLVMDVNTAANNVDISEDRKCVSLSQTGHNRPETPERFLNFQVLSKESVSSGKHSWDIVTSKSGGWRIGMSYASIQREGPPFAIGDNNKSWCLRSFYNELTARHKCKEVRLNHDISNRKFRIVLDYMAGKLSFYQLCNPVSHLYTFTATFTEPLHAAFYVWGSKAWVRICK